MADGTERIRDVVVPVLSARDLDLYDVEVSSSLVRVIVDRAGGVNLDALGEATRAVSRALDEVDPISSSYTLEVTSPGVERPLRRPEQFVGAVGEVVRVKTIPGADGARRFHGELVAADESGITVREADGDAEDTLSYGDIAKARTVFEWGTSSPAANSTAKRPGKSKRKRESRS
jgi:ribosome maturation factor RimP